MTTPDTIRLQQHVGGWQDDSRMRAHSDPSDHRVVRALVPEGDETLVEAATAAARRGFAQWRDVSAFQRGDIIHRAADLMQSRGELLARNITREMGKPLGEARIEVARAVEQTRYFASSVRHPEGSAMRLGSNSEQAFTLRVPVGVVAAITPWNFPFMIPNWKIAPALVHGNAVVFKPAEGSPLSADGLVRCYLEAGVPPETISLVHGRGSVIGPALVGSDEVDAVTFTGSTPVGRQISATAARNGKRVQAEMGGKNAVVVMPDADLDAAVASVVLAGFGTSGQRCTSSSRVLVHRAVYDDFVDRLIEHAGRLVIGPGEREGVNVGPMASRQAMTDAMNLLEKSVADGATLLLGGHRLTDGAREHGWYIAPTVVAAEPEGTVFQEELFGPIVSVHQFEDLDHAIALNNAVRYGLSSAIYTNNLAAAHRFLREADTGMVHVNRPTVGAEAHMPFGGAKESAYGTAELGAAIDFFTRTRSAHIRW